MITSQVQTQFLNGQIDSDILDEAELTEEIAEENLDTGALTDWEKKDISKDDLYILNWALNQPLLSQKEEITLANAWQKNHDIDARDELFTRNLKLVVHLARKYCNALTLPFNDIVQEGSIGLLKACDRFDTSLGYKFSTYATWWIRQAITRANADQARLIRVPVHVTEKFAKYKKFVRSFEQTNNRLPTDQEIMDNLGFIDADLASIRLPSVSGVTVSLDLNIGEDEDTPLSEFIASDEESAEDISERSFLHTKLTEAIDRVLTKREKTVIYMRFGLDGGKQATLEDVAKTLNLTRERIRQIECKALRKLARSSELRDLNDKF